MNRYKGGRANGGGGAGGMGGMSSGRREIFQKDQDESPDNTPFIGDVNVDSANANVYLVKLPKSVYEKFTTPIAEGSVPPVLGRLRINSKEQKLFIDGAEREIYDIKFQNIPPKITVFSHTNNELEAKLRIEGKVSHQCSAQPIMDSRLRSKVRARTKMSVTKTRTTLMMDDDTRRMADNEAMKPLAGIETAKMKEERKRKKEAKRKHLDVPDDQWREIAKRAIYTAFESSIMYTAEKLSREIDEPLSRLRPVINELCTYHKSGVFSGNYVLKSEFMSKDQRNEFKRLLSEFENLEMEKRLKRREERNAEERASKRRKS